MEARNGALCFHSSRKLVVAALDHHQCAEAHQGLELCAGRTQPPAAPFGHGSSATSKKRRNGTLAGKAFSTHPVDEATDAEAAALARIHRSLVRVAGGSGVGSAAVQGDARSIAGLFQGCLRECSCGNCGRSFEDDAGALREWASLVRRAAPPSAQADPLALPSEAFFEALCKEGQSAAPDAPRRVSPDRKDVALATVDDAELLGRLVENTHPTAALNVAAASGGIAFRLPPRSGFVIGNLLSGGGGGTGSSGGAGGVGGAVPEGLAPLLAAGRRFGIITLDPPWPSRSVNRAGTYATMSSAGHPGPCQGGKSAKKRQWERTEPGDEGALQLPDDSAADISALPPALASLAALPLRGLAEKPQAASWLFGSPTTGRSSRPPRGR